MAQQNQCAVDVLPAPSGTPAGDGCVGRSAGHQDLQYTRLVIDIGDSKTIEITLRGKLTVQSVGPPAPSAGGTTTAQPGPTTGEHDRVPSEQAIALADKQFLDQMRGWLMTVATLFIGISFQAAMQPPSWITPDWYDASFPRDRQRRWYQHGSPANAAAPAPAPTMTRAQGNKATVYVFSNTITFAISLALVILLLRMNKSTPTRVLGAATSMVGILCIFVGMTFLAGNSYGPQATALVAALLVMYVLFTFLMVKYISPIQRFLCCGRCRGSRDN